MRQFVHDFLTLALHCDLKHSRGFRVVEPSYCMIRDEQLFSHPLRDVSAFFTERPSDRAN